MFNQWHNGGDVLKAQQLLLRDQYFAIRKRNHTPLWVLLSHPQFHAVLVSPRWSQSRYWARDTESLWEAAPSHTGF